MDKLLAIARVTLIESLRRKDAYVVLILAALIVFGAGLFSRFGTEGLGKFVKDVGFTVTGTLSLAICVIASARQLPTEIQNRTLYPLAAKPVGRSVIFLGKYLGVGTMASAVVILFALELYVVFRALGIEVSGVFWQALYLRVLSMWLVAALVLTLSVYLTHSANVTISLLLAIAMQTFSDSLLTIRTELDGAALRIADAAYWLLPHLELFDLSKKEVHNWPAVPAWVLGALTLYAALYSAVFIAAGCRRFGRLAL